MGDMVTNLSCGGCSGYEAMLQSAGMVQSRTFHINQADWATGSCLREGEDLYLIPVIDMANHSTLATGENAELQIAAVPAGQNTGDVSNRSFVLVASAWIYCLASVISRCII